jgi:hypothetical protein
MVAARQLGRLNDQYIQALLNADREWFIRHLAEEFTCIESNGVMRDKAGFLEVLEAGPRYAGYRLDEMRVRLLGDGAVIQATGTFTRPDGSTGSSRYTDVYLRRDGEWKVLAAQITSIQ